MILGIDTQVLVYAEVVPPKPGPKCKDYNDLRERAQLLIYKAAGQKDTIVLPTIVISELLVPVPFGKRAALIQELEKTFQCPPFDIPAAAIAADLWARFRKNVPAQTADCTREVLRADAFIVASARAANATHFYSHDKQCRFFAELAGMKACDLPVAVDLDDQYLLADIRSNTVPEIRQDADSAKKVEKSKKARNKPPKS